MTTESRARVFLSSWRFWTGVAYFGLLVVSVSLYTANSRVSRSEAARVAYVDATAQASYATCVQSIPTLRNANEFVSGVQVLAGVLLENARESHAVTPPGSATYATQTTNLQRLRDSNAEIQAMSFPQSPTVSSCAADRDAILRAGHG